jgi:hypothetical protein
MAPVYRAFSSCLRDTEEDSAMRAPLSMTRAVVILILAIGALGAVVYFLPHKSTAPAPTTYDAASLPKEYTNDAYRFSVMMPEAFTAQEIQNSGTGGETILLQDKAGNGIQIVLTPYGEDVHELTIDKIHSDIPDMRIRDTQVLEIGEEYKGVAFKSDNAAFGGDSREVWFIFRGTLYQITTYAKDDSLLQAMFATWKFF